ncbi:MAG: ferredoxin, partial [Solirubrobacteraceae bacterium]
RKTVLNADGRVLHPDSRAPIPGLYAAGWIKRGPSGVIGTNKKDAADTVGRILEDAEAGALGRPDPDAADPEAVAAWLTERVPEAVTWAGWQAIDAHESALGEPAGRPRVKLVRLAELLSASRGEADPDRDREPALER